MDRVSIKRILVAWLQQAGESFVTKTGQPIILTFTVDAYPDQTPPWIIHRADAFVEGKQVGYLKISYIPKSRFKKKYPTIWHFAQKFAGMSALDPNSSQRELWETVSRYAGFHSTGDVERDMRTYTRILSQKMRKVEDFHVDKPLVDFIRVEPEWQRQGVGRALYVYGAKQMAQRFRLPLYASGIQSEEASASWQSMKRTKGMPLKVDPKSRRRTLDYRG